MSAYASSGHLRIGTKDNGVDVRRVSTAPSAGGGLAADLGSLALNNVTGVVYVKYGAANTAWAPLSPAQYTPNELWLYNNVAASLVDAALGATVSQNFTTWRAPRAGSIVGMVARFNGAIVAGTATVKVMKNSAVVGALVVTLSPGVSEGQTVQAAGVDTYVAGDLLSMAVTTDGSFAPATLHLEAGLQVQDAT
jgi:hypothetical protein